jgi:hypothetical protein
MWRSVVWYVFPNVPEETATSIFRVEQSFDSPTLKTDVQVLAKC